jgi:hypothetical protein
MAVTARSPQNAENIGSYGPFATGVTLMASGTATVDLSAVFHQVYGAVGSVVDAATGVGQTVTFSFSGTGNVSMVIETISEAGSLAGTSLVGWIAWGVPKA